jgi:hypothetical protein
LENTCPPGKFLVLSNQESSFRGRWPWGDTQQPQPAGTARAEAAAELAEIQRRHEQVIKAVLVPLWYWWGMAAAMVAYGAGRDIRDVVVKVITIPLAVLVMVALTVAVIPEIRRRVQVHLAARLRGRGATAIFGLILLVNAVAIANAASPAAARVSYPVTIGCATGAAVLVIAGPLVNQYLRRLMLSQARQQINDAPQAAGTA